MKSNDVNVFLENIIKKIISVSSPLKIYIYSEKHLPNGTLASIKFCVIIDDNKQPDKVEENLYLELDVEIPCDILVYTEGEFNSLLKQKLSFAANIIRSGRIIYETD